MTEPGRRKQFVKALASFSPTVYPREVVKRALELSATAVILVHKRPTRNPTRGRSMSAFEGKADVARPWRNVRQ